MMHSGKGIYSFLPFEYQDTYLSDEYSCDTKIESFEKYMSRVGEPIFIDKYYVPFVYKFRGKIFELTYVPEAHRPHFKRIVHFVSALHKMGRSLEALDESNIVFHNNKLKLPGLKFVHKFVHSLRVEDRKHDYTLLHNLLKRLFDKYNYNKYKRPRSLDDLLSIITECSESGNLYGITPKSSLALHSVFDSHATSVERTKNLIDNTSYIRDRKHKDAYNTAVSKMQRREIYKRDWGEWFYGSHPEVGPAQDCFKYEPPTNKFEYVGVGPDRVVNRHIYAKILRNMATHLHQHIPKHNNGSEFSKKDVDLIIMALFEDELLSFQRLTF